MYMKKLIQKYWKPTLIIIGVILLILNIYSKFTTNKKVIDYFLESNLAMKNK